MPTLTLNPAAATPDIGWSLFGTAGSELDAISDDIDANYISQGLPTIPRAALLSFTVDTPVIPAGARIASVTLKGDLYSTSPNGMRVHSWWKDEVFAPFVEGPEQVSPIITATAGSWVRNVVLGTWTTRSDDPTVIQYWLTSDFFRSFFVSPYNVEGSSGSGLITKLWLEVDYAVAPVVAVTAPTGTLTDATPDVSWTYTDAEAPQLRTEILFIKSGAQGSGNAPVGTPEFDPDDLAGSDQIGLTRTVFGPSTSLADPGAIPIGSWWVYVRSEKQWTHSSSDPFWSEWSYLPFTLNLTSPAPGIEVYPDADNGRVGLVISTSANLMPAETAEGGALQGLVHANTVDLTIATAQSLVGVDPTSIYTGQNGSDDVSFKWISRPGYLEPGTSFWARAAVWEIAQVANATLTATVHELDSGGARTVNNGTATSGVTALPTASWTELAITGTLPSIDALYGWEIEWELVIGGDASGEVYIDALGFGFGADPGGWSPGVGGSSIIEVQRSVDQINWSPVRDTLEGARGNVFDYEAPAYVPVYYRARTAFDEGVSVWIALPPATLELQHHWLVGVPDTTLRMPISVASERLSPRRTQRFVERLNEGLPSVLDAGHRGFDVNIRFNIDGQDRHDEIQEILRDNPTLLYRDYDGNAIYFKVTGGGLRRKRAVTPQWQGARPTRIWWEVTLTGREVPAP